MAGMQAGATRLALAAADVARGDQARPASDVVDLNGDVAPPQTYSRTGQNYSAPPANPGPGGVTYRQIAPGYFEVYNPAKADDAGGRLLVRADTSTVEQKAAEIAAALQFQSSARAASVAIKMEAQALDLKA